MPCSKSCFFFRIVVVIVVFVIIVNIVVIVIVLVLVDIVIDLVIIVIIDVVIVFVICYCGVIARAKSCAISQKLPLLEPIQVSTSSESILEAVHEGLLVAGAALGITASLAGTF